MTGPLRGWLTPERIVAFVDRELPEGEHRAVAAAIAADPAAQAMAAAMRRSGAAAASAFDETLQAPLPPRLAAWVSAAQAPDEPYILGFARRLRPAGWAQAAGVAFLALLVGMAAGHSLRGVDAPLRLASDSPGDPAAARLAAALYQALDRGRPGDSVDYDESSASISGRITVLGELPTRSGLPCREFSHTVRHGNQSRAENGVACRNPGGGWETLLLPAGQ